MKFHVARGFMVGAVLFFSLRTVAQNANNPIQIATLRWYQANTVAAFTTCPATDGIAFDGAHVWVACAGSGGVYKL
jgi:hypothetical protein